MMGRFFCLIFLILSISAAAEDGAAIVGTRHELFSKKKDQFIPDGKKTLFSWSSEIKTAAFYARVPGQEKALTLYGKNVLSAYVRFSGNSPSVITFTLYDQTVKQPLSSDHFMKEMKAVYMQLKKRYPGIKPKFFKASQDELKINAAVWVSGKYVCMMKWGIRKDVPEYLQIEFISLSGKNLSRRDIMRTHYTAGKSEKLTKTEQTENGDVYLRNFPMIVQPEKGCSAASVVQRILEYKGMKPEKPIVASALKKGVKLFTDTDELPWQLAEICQENNLKLTSHFVLFYKDRSLRKLENLAGRYNRAVRKPKKERLTVAAGGKLPVVATIKKMTPEVYIKLRNEEHGEQVFENAILQNVMSGQPVIWYVIMGIVKEDNLPKIVPALHMRLIIGFNATTKTVIYTDCWGKGHEIKRMPYEKAWAITLGTYTISPRE